VPLADDDPAHLLAELKARQVVCSVRDGNLRLALHLYNHEDDIDLLTAALSEL
jgi:selenocysteine lyase/cysteine desulfurase